MKAGNDGKSLPLPKPCRAVGQTNVLPLRSPTAGMRRCPYPKGGATSILLLPIAVHHRDQWRKAVFVPMLLLSLGVMPVNVSGGWLACRRCVPSPMSWRILGLYYNRSAGWQGGIFGRPWWVPRWWVPCWWHSARWWTSGWTVACCACGNFLLRYLSDCICRWWWLVTIPICRRFLPIVTANRLPSPVKRPKRSGWRASTRNRALWWRQLSNRRWNNRLWRWRTLRGSAIRFAPPSHPSTGGLPFHGLVCWFAIQLGWCNWR